MHEDVGNFQISMDDVLIGEIFQSQIDVFDDGEGFFFVEIFG